MSEIAIFVSHRTDIDSECINNPIYHNIACGKALEKDYDILPGDDTGDNISKKKERYSEYTVQYWAWKNYDADYYGLCHYRRYLSFADEFFEEWNDQRFVFEPCLTQESVRKYGLLSPEEMKKKIEKYDVVTSVTYETSNTPVEPRCHTVRDLFACSPQLLTSYEDIALMQKIVEEKFPQYSKALADELDSERHRGFNCYVMKKELFQLMCEYEFGVFFELEKKLSFNNNPRELGYLGEMLYGSFIRWVNYQKKYKVKETQIVLFQDTRRRPKRTILSAAKQKTKSAMKKFCTKTMPAYRVSLRTEQDVLAQNGTVAALNAKVDFLNAKIDVLTSELRLLSQREMSSFWTQPRQFDYDNDENKLNFWRSYPKATGDLRMIQQAQLSMLKRFRDICEKADVRFWLHGNSLVGALRHGGFIPWSFDVCVGMMRDDLEKIKEYVNSESDDGKYSITDNYYLHIAAKTYKFQRADLESNCAVSIAVYDPYDLKFDDPVSDWLNLSQQKVHMTSLLADTCKELDEFPDEPTLEGYDDLKEALDEVFDKFITRSRGGSGSRYVLWGMDNAYDAPGTYTASHGRIFDRQDIFPLKECEFEGEKFSIPCNYDKYTFAESGTRYVEVPQNMGESSGWKQFFATQEQLETARQIIEEEIKA